MSLQVTCHASLHALVPYIARGGSSADIVHALSANAKQVATANRPTTRPTFFISMTVASFGLLGPYKLEGVTLRVTIRFTRTEPDLRQDGRFSRSQSERPPTAGQDLRRSRLVISRVPSDCWDPKTVELP